jgi:hypothetical protein
MVNAENKIELIFRRQDFEDIYFKNGKGDIFWSKNIKEYFIIFLVFASVFFVSLAYSLFMNLLWGLTLFLLLTFLLSLFTYAGHIFPTIKWKKQITKYLNSLTKIKKHEITLSAEAFIMTQDDEVTINRWLTFTKVILNDESIMLFGNDMYLFPKKSMDELSYKYLADFISDKLKNRV